MPVSDGARGEALDLRITIVTPSLNQGRYLEAALASIHSQADPNLEHIVMDGGSSDGSLAILERHRAKLAHLQSQPDGGQTDALINGFARATGDVLGWLNADDELEPGALAQVRAFFLAHPEARFVFGNATWIDEGGQVLRRKREIPFVKAIWLRTYDYIPQPSAFWRRDLYEEVGGLDPTYDLAMDADLFARFAERTRPHHVSRFWSRMREHQAQKNVRFRERSNAEEARIRSRYLSATSGPRWVAERALARGVRVVWRAAIGAYR